MFCHLKLLSFAIQCEIDCSSLRCHSLDGLAWSGTSWGGNHRSSLGHNGWKETSSGRRRGPVRLCFVRLVRTVSWSRNESSICPRDRLQWRCLRDARPFCSLRTESLLLPWSSLFRMPTTGLHQLQYLLCQTILSTMRSPKRLSISGRSPEKDSGIRNQ